MPSCRRPRSSKARPLRSLKPTSTTTSSRPVRCSQSRWGRPVRLVRTNPATGQVTERRGVLRSAPDGVLIDFDGEIEALKCSGLNERLVFDDVPESLTDTPTLSMLVRVPEGGRFEVRLSYLALGLDWSADYVARIHPDGRRLDLSAWLTLVNRYGTHFTDATAHVVAGNLARDEETQPPQIETPKQQDRCWPIGEFRVIRAPLAPLAPRRELQRNYMSLDSAALQEIVVTGSYVAKVSQLGDYKLYSSPVTTTVAPRQMKQVRMLVQENVRFERLYEYEIEESGIPESLPRDRPWVLLRLENKERNGLGVALPGGRVAVMEGDASGKQILAGENTVEDTPVDLPFDIRYAKAMDVWVTPRIVEDVRREQAGGAMVQRSFQVEIANDKPIAVTLEVMHRPDSMEDFRVVSESRRHEMKLGAGTLVDPPAARTALRAALCNCAQGLVAARRDESAPSRNVTSHHAACDA